MGVHTPEDQMRAAGVSESKVGAMVAKKPLSSDVSGSAKDEVQAVVEEFNSRFMVVNEAGKAIIYAPGFDQILKRRVFNRMTFDDFRRLYMNRLIRVGTDDKGNAVWKTAATVWLQHRERRQFTGGVVFDPSGSRQPDDVLNLWNGFAVNPAPGDWSLLLEHIKTIICAGDPERLRYLMGWLAQMMQRPAEQGEVAVVMRGGEGTGKGTVARAAMHILGSHGLAISNSKHLVGNFNGHLRDAVFLFADEAFFAGDKASIGVLKSLITEPYLTVESKFQNAVQMPNFLHVMMASNEEWVVPASQDARRFFVLEVAETRKNDHAYFVRISKQMDAGGYEAMLHDLLKFDLTGFNVRAVPVTEGLQTQRKLSLPPAELWWKDCLERGYVFRSRLGLEEIFGKWCEEASTELLFASYIEFAKERHERHPMSRETIGRFLVRMGLRPKRLANAPVGEHSVESISGYGGTGRTAKANIQSRAPGYRLGTLPAARASFSDATKLQIRWPDEGIEE